MRLQSTGAAIAAETPTAMTIKELAPWFHNVHLPSGEETAPDHPLGDFPAVKWAQIADHLPSDLRGARALDIGCNAGFYTFELARRGASVLGIDREAHYLRQARWLAGELGLERRIELRQMQVYDLRELREQFDLVLFLGVLYHLRYPLLGLDLVAERARGTLVVQTLTMPGDETVLAPFDLDLGGRAAMVVPGWPKLAFIEHRLADDPSNWWAPNHAAVEAMLRSCGMRVTARPGHEIYICRRERDVPEVSAELDAAMACRRRG